MKKETADKISNKILYVIFFMILLQLNNKNNKKGAYLK